MNINSVFDQYPPELIFNILNFADALTLAQFSLCGHGTYHFANDNILWKNKLFSDFGEDLPIPQQFMEYYKEYYKWLVQNQMWTAHEINVRFNLTYEKLFLNYISDTETTFLTECCRQRLTDRLNKKELLLIVFVRHFKLRQYENVLKSLVEWDVPMITTFADMAQKNPYIVVSCILLSFCALNYQDLHDICFPHCL